MTPQVLFQEAVAHHQKGNLAEAEKLYEQFLAAEPGIFQAWYLFATLHYQRGRAAGALPAVDRALSLNPESAEAHNLRGVLLLGGGRFLEALGSLDRALSIDPGFVIGLFNRGVALKGLKRPAEALVSYERALALAPDNAELHYNRGIVLGELKREEEAVESFERAVALRPDHVEAWNNLGGVLQGLRRYAEALSRYDRALALKPDYGAAHANRGIVLRDLKRHAESLESYDRSLVLRPDHARTLDSRGLTLLDLERFEEALGDFDRALELDPSYAQAHGDRGLALAGLDRPEEALASYERALALDPSRAEVWNNRASILRTLKRYEESVASYDRALALDPGYGDAWNNRGNALLSLERFDEAIASYDRALAINPDDVGALYRRGSTHWTEFRRYEPAIRDLEQVVLADPDYEYAQGNLLHLKMYGGDWRDYERTVRLIDEGVRAGKRIVTPFAYEALSERPEDLLACAKIYADHLHSDPAPAIWKGGERRGSRIRLGYVSAEFRSQATAYLMTQLYELHDKDRFELIAFDNGWNDHSEIRRRLESAFDKFIDISKLTDQAAAERVFAEEAEILINLNGYFGKLRMGVFAKRPAPIQVNYLGFPGTLGAGYMDYIVADRIVIPEDERQYYTEKVVYLPETYQVNDAKRGVAPETPSRAECGLPQGAFVFASFNQSYKLLPGTFALWMNILKQVEGSVLWLLQSSTAFPENLRREAARHGVAPERLIFAPYLPTDRHLARIKLADLFLDSLPYNAHTTASDALWLELPILTCRGTSFPGRVAASLLEAIGLPELITENLADYEALALRLAREPALLKSIREKLARNRLTTPLFDADRFRRHIESAYVTMWETWRRGDPPASFAVARLP